jgi:addiction module HigA family antidote
MPRAIKYRMPPHPGRILRDDLLAPLGMSINQLAHALCVPANRLSQIVQGKRAITPDTSLRLARYFGFGHDYWLNLQAHYDLEVARRRLGQRIEGEIKPREAA